MSIGNIDWSGLAAGKGLARGMSVGSQLAQNMRNAELQRANIGMAERQEQRDIQAAQMKAQQAETMRQGQSVIRGAAEALKFTDEGSQNAFLDRRIEQLRQNGYDPSDTLMVRQMPFAERAPYLENIVSRGLEIPELASSILGVGGPDSKLSLADRQNFRGPNGTSVTRIASNDPNKPVMYVDPTGAQITDPNILNNLVPTDTMGRTVADLAAAENAKTAQAEGQRIKELDEERRLLEEKRAYDTEKANTKAYRARVDAQTALDNKRFEKHSQEFSQLEENDDVLRNIIAASYGADETWLGSLGLFVDQLGAPFGIQAAGKTADTATLKARLKVGQLQSLGRYFKGNTTNLELAEAGVASGANGLTNENIREVSAGRVRENFLKKAFNEAEEMYLRDSSDNLTKIRTKNFGPDQFEQFEMPVVTPQGVKNLKIRNIYETMVFGRLDPQAFLTGQAPAWAYDGSLDRVKEKYTPSQIGQARKQRKLKGLINIEHQQIQSGQATP